jgi:hypothetical protein
MIIPERLEKIEATSLKAGFHDDEKEFSVMEAVAYIVGEPCWNSHPECSCPFISTFLNLFNDALPTDDDRNRLLKPLIVRLVGTRNKELEKRRSLMAVDWTIRVGAPSWLRFMGLFPQAEYLELLPEITSEKQCSSLKGILDSVRYDAAAARDKVSSAAEHTAISHAADGVHAAYKAALWASSWAVCLDPGEESLKALAWAAVLCATVDSSIIEAETADVNFRLAPTVATLHQSAVKLVDRMIDLNKQ